MPALLDNSDEEDLVVHLPRSKKGKKGKRTSHAKANFSGDSSDNGLEAEAAVAPGAFDENGHAGAIEGAYLLKYETWLWTYRHNG